jgi:hypothetical protein
MPNVIQLKVYELLSNFCLALGVFRTSPVESLYAEAGEPSLHIHLKKLSLQYATRISSNIKNPAKNIIFKPSYTEKFVNKPKEIKPLGLGLTHYFMSIL